MSAFSAYSDALRLFIREARQHSVTDSRFNELALRLFALQFAHVAPYQKFCVARGCLAENVKRWKDIPALPTAAFKEWEITSLLPRERTREFHSSGTTHQPRSRHFHNAESLAIYEASLLPSFEQHVLRAGESTTDGPAPPNKPFFLMLTPSPAQAIESSLVHMFETVRREFASDDSAWLGYRAENGDWAVDADAGVSALRHAATGNRPVILLGTAFLFVHLLDHLAARDLSFQLTRGSRVLETGGYKGRSRMVSKEELHGMISKHLGISRIICEYGMSELSSQAYDSAAGVTGPAGSAVRQFHMPPWARVRIISPETGTEVQPGETGLVQIFDLANVRSVAAIQTEDLAVRGTGGFALVGRAERSEARGCSLMTP